MSRVASISLVVALLAVPAIAGWPVSSARAAPQGEEWRTSESNAEAPLDETGTDAIDEQTPSCAEIADPMQRDECISRLIQGLGGTGASHSGLGAGGRSGKGGKNRKKTSSGGNINLSPEGKGKSAKGGGGKSGRKGQKGR